MRKWCLAAGIVLCLALAVLACVHVAAWYCLVMAKPAAYSPEDAARKYRYLTRALRCEPDNPKVYYLMGRMYEEIRQRPYLARRLPDLPRLDKLAKKRCLELAIRAYRDAAERDPRNARYHHCLGRLYLEVPARDDESAQEKASAELEEAIELDPTNPLHHYWMGICYQMSGLLPGAISKYRDAIERSAAFGPRVLETAWKNGRYAAALQKIVKGYETLQALLPEFLIRQEAIAAARAACITACQGADDFRPEHQIQLLAQLLQLKRPGLAKLYALTWIEKGPSVPLQFMVVSACELGGERELAIREMVKIVKQTDATPEHHARLADLYRNADRDKRAVRHYEKAIELEPRNPIRYDALAEFYRDQKQAEAVVRTYARLCEVLPGNALACYLLGNARMALPAPDLDGAIGAFREAVRLAPRDKRFKRALAGACARRAREEQGANAKNRNDAKTKTEKTPAAPK